jgi:hypothetical protein
MWCNNSAVSVQCFHSTERLSCVRQTLQKDAQGICGYLQQR